MKKQLVIITVGSPEKGWVASRKLMDEMKVSLDQAIASGMVKEFLITHPYIQMSEIDVTVGACATRIVGIDADVKDENAN